MEGSKSAVILFRQRSDPQISIDSTLLVLSLSLVFRLHLMDFYTGLIQYVQKRLQA